MDRCRKYWIWRRLPCREFCDRGRGQPLDCDRFEKLVPTSGQTRVPLKKLGQADRRCGWRMPTREPMERMASQRPLLTSEPAPDESPDARWDSVLADPRAAGEPWLPIQQRRLSEIPRHLLRVECLRCLRIVEILKADALRLYGPHAVWKDVGARLLDNTCQDRTGRLEEDGCWPSWNSWGAAGPFGGIFGGIKSAIRQNYPLIRAFCHTSNPARGAKQTSHFLHF